MVTHIITIDIQLRPARPVDLKNENVWITPKGPVRDIEPKYGQEFFLKSKDQEKYEYQVVDGSTDWDVIRAYMSEGLIFVQDRLLPK